MSISGQKIEIQNPHHVNAKFWLYRVTYVFQISKPLQILVKLDVFRAIRMYNCNSMSIDAKDLFVHIGIV